MALYSRGFGFHWIIVMFKLTLVSIEFRLTLYSRGFRLTLDCNVVGQFYPGFKVVQINPGGGLD